MGEMGERREKERERERERERDTARQKDRQSDRQTEAEREIDRQTDRHTDRRQTYILHTGRQADRENKNEREHDRKYLGNGSRDKSWKNGGPCLRPYATLSPAPFFHFFQVHDTYHDLMPSLQVRCSEVAGATNTIVCNSVLFDRRNKKVISGRELMMLQGYPEALLDAGSNPSNSQLTELAGNAYNAFSFSNILLSMLATVPINLSGVSYMDHPDRASRNFLFSFILHCA